jgi:hypothetical protein
MILERRYISVKSVDSVSVLLMPPPGRLPHFNPTLALNTKWKPEITFQNWNRFTNIALEMKLLLVPSKNNMLVHVMQCVTGDAEVHHLQNRVEESHGPIHMNLLHEAATPSPTFTDSSTFLILKNK